MGELNWPVASLNLHGLLISQFQVCEISWEGSSWFCLGHMISCVPNHWAGKADTGPCYNFRAGEAL